MPKSVNAAGLFLLVAILAGCQGHTLDAHPFSDDAIQWGQSVDGLQIGMARRTYEPGEAPELGQLYFTVLMRNVTRRPLSILAPTKLRGTLSEKPAGDESVNVTLTYDGAPAAKPAVFKPENKPVVQVMEPGRDYPMELRLSPETFGLDHFVPGRITATYSNAQTSIHYAAMGGEPTTGLWIGKARSGAVRVDAPAATTQRQGGGQTP
jgi:hypothetical protein